MGFPDSRSPARSGHDRQLAARQANSRDDGRLTISSDRLWIQQRAPRRPGHLVVAGRHRHAPGSSDQAWSRWTPRSRSNPDGSVCCSRYIWSGGIVRWVCRRPRRLISVRPSPPLPTVDFVRDSRRFSRDSAVAAPEMAESIRLGESVVPRHSVQRRVGPGAVRSKPNGERTWIGLPSGRAHRPS